MNIGDPQPAAQQTRATEVELRLSALRAVYDRYRDMDALIMDPLFLVGDRSCHEMYRRLIREMWTAIKTACEETEP